MAARMARQPLRQAGRPMLEYADQAATQIMLGHEAVGPIMNDRLVCVSPSGIQTSGFQLLETLVLNQQEMDIAAGEVAEKARLVEIERNALCQINAMTYSAALW